MYSAVKSNAVSEAAARTQVGEAVNRVLTLNCEPTNKVIEDKTVLTTVYYLVNAGDYNEDIGDFNYSDCRFMIKRYRPGASRKCKKEE